MRALLLCVGSRGDAEPFCALADRLLDGGHGVDMFLQTDLRALAPPERPHLRIRDFPFTQLDFYRCAAKNPRHGQDRNGNPRVRFVAIVAEVIGELVLPCASRVLDVASGGGGGDGMNEGGKCDVVVASALARNLAFLVSDQLGVPSCLVHLQPLLPTPLFPHSSNTGKCVELLVGSAADDGSCSLEPNPEHLESYVMLERYQHEFLADRLIEMYRKVGADTTAATFEAMMERLRSDHPTTGIFNAFGNPLLPKTGTAATPRVYDVGPLADAYVPKDFVPPDGLEAFLEEGGEGGKPPVICVGYGSMPYDAAAAPTLLKSLREVGCRAVLVGDALKMNFDDLDFGDDGDCDDWARTSVWNVSSVPYAWLLPRCQLILCHGGAGVVHSALRAGIPTVISPLMGDQFFFAELLQAKGLGVRAGETLPTAAGSDLVRAIEKARECMPKAKEYGERVRAKELGVSNMYRVLQSVAETGTFPQMSF